MGGVQLSGNMKAVLCLVSPEGPSTSDEMVIYSVLWLSIVYAVSHYVGFTLLSPVDYCT